MILDIRPYSCYYSGSCLPSCLKMFLDYHQLKTPVGKILDEVEHSPKEGAHMEAAACFIASLNLRVVFHSFQPNIDPHWYKTASGEKIIKHLRDYRYRYRKKSNERKCLDWILKFMRRGGVLKPFPMTLKSLKRKIRDKKPVIVAIERTLITSPSVKKRIGNMPHAVLVIGYENGQIIFNDPYYCKKRIRESEERFTQAWYLNSGSAIYLK